MSTLLVDGNNLLMRAIHATYRSGMSVDDVPTGPLHVFASTLTRHVRDERPDRVAVAWDSGPSVERTALDKGYKANRSSGPVAEVKESAFPMVREFLSLANVYQFSIPGQEADDLIAAWWRGSVDDRIKILSSDKDFLQLLGFTPLGCPTEVIRLSSAGTPTDRWDVARFLEADEYGYPPGNWPLVTALTGDTSDNVQGVPGIGPKRAVKLLEAHSWDLDAALEDPKVSGYADQVRTNLRLVDLRHGQLVLEPPPPFRPTRPGGPLHHELESFLDRWRLSSVSDRYLSGALWETPADAVATRSPRGFSRGAPGR